MGESCGPQGVFNHLIGSPLTSGKPWNRTRDRANPELVVPLIEAKLPVVTKLPFCVCKLEKATRATPITKGVGESGGRQGASYRLISSLPPTSEEARRKGERWTATKQIK